MHLNKLSKYLDLRFLAWREGVVEAPAERDLVVVVAQRSDPAWLLNSYLVVEGLELTVKALQMAPDWLLNSHLASVG